MSNRFYVYNTENNHIITGLLNYIDKFNDKKFSCTEVNKNEIATLIKDLVLFSEEHGFYDNLWQDILTYFLLMDENAYTLSIERDKHDSLPGAYELCLLDIKTIMKYYNEDFKKFSNYFEFSFSSILNYKKSHSGGVFSESVKDIIMKVSKEFLNAKTPEDFLDILNNSYKQYGVGNLGYHKAFRIKEDGTLVPINKIANVHFDDLIGLPGQKEELISNTRSFVKGNCANNCLLYGDAGTGKSSSIKALANEFYKDGLRIVEIYKHELKSLNNVIANIKGRNYKFIIYMDDLSFEEFETEYKYLKALIEGGLEKKPDNVLIYATSNRRHLVRESFADRNDDIHRNDTMQEKLSLFGRFGVTIFFGAPDKNEYNNIVLGLKEKYNIDISDDELLKKANAWEVSNGRSGRSAEQLLDYIRSKE